MSTLLALISTPISRCPEDSQQSHVRIGIPIPNQFSSALSRLKDVLKDGGDGNCCDQSASTLAYVVTAKAGTSHTVL
jgi:hypothetical protein